MGRGHTQDTVVPLKRTPPVLWLRGLSSPRPAEPRDGLGDPGALPCSPWQLRPLGASR